MSTNPNTVKSQDDTTEDELGRTMTLLRAIEQLEKTECRLEKVEKQLDIAIGTLRCYGNPNNWNKNRFTIFFPSWVIAQENLKKIQELNK